ncbi:hypothetical protein RclHR1_12100003 [Rhizophagus clarus]|uniref:Uncharacterized protein n=1 Tax=Rhizophagus clarus TaxID=94130 RepID=A0A2Z6Q694_9GLOM|nr:hypothetical protein RclHR1_12100003 [Rhizophagus clarus]
MHLVMRNFQCDHWQKNDVDIEPDQLTMDKTIQIKTSQNRLVDIFGKDLEFLQRDDTIETLWNRNQDQMPI